VVAGAGCFLSTGSGTTVGVGYVANVCSGAGAGSTDGRESTTVGKVGAGSPGSGVISGDGTVATAKSGFSSFVASGVCNVSGVGVVFGEGSIAVAESMFGSFVASGVCNVSGAGTAGTSVITGVSVAAGVDGIVSSTRSWTSTGVEYVAKAGSGAGVSSTESDTDGSNVTGDSVAAGGSAVVISFAAIGSVARVPAVTSVNIGGGKVTHCGSGQGEGCGCGQGEG
jgi:hypothetical protein